MNTGPLDILLTAFGSAALAPVLARRFPRAAPWLLGAVPVCLFARTCLWIGPILGGRILTNSYSWIPGLDLYLSFFVDGLALLFALLVTGIGGFVFLYSKAYLAEDPHIGRFYAYLLMFMGSMLGVVVSGNLISLYLFWEMTSVSSFLLIGYHHEQEGARRAALQALVVTNIGGLALLAGLILLAQAGNSYELNELLGRAAMIGSDRHRNLIVMLICMGAFTKSAQIPFHFWLPNAMRAPTPVSAYLHSATMVKAGVYLLARLHPILGDNGVWSLLTLGAGCLSLVVGGFMALSQRDIKRILAYSTISVLGVLVLLMGIGTDAAIQAAVVYLITHALYKSTLFLCAGAIDHQTSLRDVTRMRGLGTILPWIAVAGIAAAVSKSGLPPAIGFIGKELIFKAGLRAPVAPFPVTFATIFGSAFLVAVAWTVGIRPFFGRSRSGTRPTSPLCWEMSAGPVILGLSGIYWGLFPDPFATALLQKAASAAAGHPLILELKLWHGVTKPALLSAVAVAGGLALYLGRERLRRWASRFGWVARFGPERVYERLLAILSRYAGFQTRILQSGYLRQYLLIVFAFLNVLVITGLIRTGRLVFMPIDGSLVTLLALAVVVLIIGSVGVVLRSPSMLAAVIALGVIGYGQAFFYVLYSAPDLALTQILVETVTLVLFALIVYRLPALKRISKIWVRRIDAIVAVTLGAVMTLLTLQTGPLDSANRISAYFAAKSSPLGHGKNIVNVILIDFRGLDTLGEITVLAVTALGVFALLKLRLSQGDE